VRGVGVLRSLLDGYGAPMACAAVTAATWAPLWGARETLAAGGGAGLVAYVLLMLLLATPWVWFELAAGGCLHCGLTELWRRSARRWEWVGWWTALLALVLAVTALALGGVAVVQAGRGIGALLGGSLDATRPMAAAASPVPLGGAVAVAVTALVALLWLLGGGVAQTMRWMLLVATVGGTAAVLALGLGLASQPVRGGLVHFLAIDFARWLEPEVWVAAGGWAALSVLPAFGIQAILTARRQRVQDTGGGTLLVVLAATTGGVVSALLAALIDALTQARHPGAALDWPILLEPYLGVVPAAPLELLAVVAACLAWSASGLLMALLLFAVLGDAGQRAGTASQRRLSLHFALLAAVCLIVISEQGLWWARNWVALCGMVALPLVGLFAVRGLREARVLPGLIDHARAHSSIALHRSMPGFLGVLMPVLLLSLVAAAVVWQLVLPWWQSAMPDRQGVLWAGGTTIVLGSALGARWMAAVSRVEPARLSGVIAALLGAVLVVIAGTNAVLAMNSAERRHVRASFASAVAAQAESLSGGMRGDPEALLRLARRAWNAGDEDLAKRCLALWTATSRPQRTAAVSWTGELVVAAQAALEEHPRPDLRRVLVVMGLLRALGSQDSLATVQAQWARRVEDTALARLEQTRDALTAVIDVDGRLDAQAVLRAEAGWTRFVDDLHGPHDLELWAAAPDPVGQVARQLAARVQGLVHYGNERHLAPRQAQAIASLAVASGMVEHVSRSERAWVGETLAAHRPWVSTVVMLVIMAVMGIWTAVVVVTRILRGPAPIDPHADTLLHVDPIDVDTQAVTMEGAYTTDGATTTGGDSGTQRTTDDSSDSRPVPVL